MKIMMSVSHTILNLDIFIAEEMYITFYDTLS